MLEFLKTLDRRWIFLAMLLAVSGPILAEKVYPEKPTKVVQDVFDYIENLPDGSNVLFSFDYSPSSDGELAPMARALLRHCCLKRHKMFFMTLFPDGLPLLKKNIELVLETEFASLNLKDGEDYVNLGYNNAQEVAIIVMGTDLQKMFPFDSDKRPLSEIPLTENISSLQDMDLIVTISTGYPGMKEWVQYAASPHGIKLAVASTAVQATQAYPYIPNQLLGILAAIKGAAEYEAALATRYPQYRDPKTNQGPDPRRNDAIRRMAPQFWGHLLIIALILLGNGIYFAERHRGGRR